jgi:hypothetical protein
MGIDQVLMDILMHNSSFKGNLSIPLFTPTFYIWFCHIPGRYAGRGLKLLFKAFIINL